MHIDKDTHKDLLYYIHHWYYDIGRVVNNYHCYVVNYHPPPVLTGRDLKMSTVHPLSVHMSVLSDFSEVPGPIVFNLGTVTKYHGDLMYLKQILAMCQKMAIMSFLLDLIFLS